MRFLLIDTCGAEGTIALADTSLATAVVASEVLPGRSSSERLVPVVRRLMELQGWSLAELAAIVVVHGPGSFTGVRVGLSAAKGLSEASGAPLIAVSRLAVMAAGGGRRVHVALDAGRGEVYYGRYEEGQPAAESLLTRAELRESLGGEPVLISETRMAEGLDGFTVKMVPEAAAADALGLAVARAEAGEFDDAATLDANYLRRTDAQLFARTT